MFQNGFLSALPHLCLWWFSMPWGWFADYLIRTEKLSQPSVRKLSNAVGMIGPSLGLLCLAFVRCNNALTIIALCFSCALYGALYSGYQVRRYVSLDDLYSRTANSYLIIEFSFCLIQATYGELSPNYSGTVAGIVSAIGNSMGFLSPMIVAAFVDDNVSILLL